MRVRRSTDERGAGLVASFAGLLVVLVLLLFAVETLASLYARTSVTAAAHDGARTVASDDLVRAGDRSPQGRVIGAAEAEVRLLLGRAGETAELAWSFSADEVVLRVRARRPSILPAPWRPGGDPGWIERTVRVRIERLR
jgi:hypothetical protein